MLNGRWADLRTERGTIYAKKASNTSTEWQVPLGAALYSTPIVKGNSRVVGVTDHPENLVLVKLQAETGNRIWSFTPRQ